MKKMFFTIAVIGSIFSGCSKFEETPTQSEEAGKSEAETRARPDGYDGANWMGRLDDSTPLTAVSIPGTHDSGTFGVIGLDLPDISRCQNTWTTFEQQLNDGIRFFDLRIGSDGNLHHGYVVCFDSWPNPITIDETFDRTIDFLNDHPTETVIVMVKHEYGDNAQDYLNHLNAAIDEHGDKIYTGTSKDITLSEVRGKIVMLDGQGNLGKGIKANAMHGGGVRSEGGLYWQNLWDIGDNGMTVIARAEMKVDAIVQFNESVVNMNDESAFCFNWWNKSWNALSTVKYYSELIEAQFYGKYDGQNEVYYPQGVQIMDYYNPHLVYEVIESNWNN
jgi:hypothetical protein